MRKICISLSKGGVAKSTSAVSLAHGLSMKGKKTLLIDSDDQGQTAYLLGVKPEVGLANVLNEEMEAKEAIYKARDNLYILAGDKTLSGTKRSIGRKDFGAEQTLSHALSSVEGKYDFVIIDTSPSWDTLTINSVFYCTEILIPVSLEVLSLNSLSEFLRRLNQVLHFKQTNQFDHKINILPTFSDGRVKKSKEILDILETHYSKMLLSPIRYCSRISESAAFGKTIFEYAPTSRGAQDYSKIITAVMK
jgi:chromosome partitioning protein